MNKVKNLQEIKSNKQSKYDKIIEYLKQDNGYWLENDKWDLTKDFFCKKKICNRRFINFETINNEYLKNEIKYFFVYSFKNRLRRDYDLARIASLIKYFSEIYKGDSLEVVDKDKLFKKWLFLLNKKRLNTDISGNKNVSFFNSLIDFIKDFYDDREETEKDIWYSKNIVGAKIPASGANNIINNQLNFNNFPIYYRNMIKRYFKTIITKKSWAHCHQILQNLRYFFNKSFNSSLFIPKSS